jgi:hypothetical protein
MATGIPLTNYPIFQQPSAQNQPPDNPGDDLHLHVNGYPRLAFFFAQSTRYLHLRRFSALAVRLLLYRQHELAVLEESLLDMEKRDATSTDPNRQLFLGDFALLKAAPDTKDGTEQKELYEKLKSELKEYGVLEKM